MVRRDYHFWSIVLSHATTPGKVQHSHPSQGTMSMLRLSVIPGATGLPCPSQLDINSALRLW